MWEIFTAEQLYEGMTVGQVLYAVAYSGSRPTVPPGCPPRYAEVMEACWCTEPADRCAAKPCCCPLCLQQLLTTVADLGLRLMFMRFASRCCDTRWCHPPVFLVWNHQRRM